MSTDAVLQGDLEAIGVVNHKRSIADTARNVGLGILALAVAAAGAFVPVLPGWIFAFVGVLLMGSAIPPLRRAMSALIMRSGAVVDRCISRPSANRLLVKTLRRPSIRSSLEPSARWALINRAAQRAAQGGEGDDEPGLTSQ